MRLDDNLNIVLQQHPLLTVLVGLLKHLHRHRTIELRNTHIVENNLIQSTVDLYQANVGILLVTCFIELNTDASVGCHGLLYQL